MRMARLNLVFQNLRFVSGTPRLGDLSRKDIDADKSRAGRMIEGCYCPVDDFHNGGREINSTSPPTGDRQGRQSWANFSASDAPHRGEKQS
jgi:hypothetical protein